jgi:hypothetical protein
MSTQALLQKRFLLIVGYSIVGCDSRMNIVKMTLHLIIILISAMQYSVEGLRCRNNSLSRSRANNDNQCNLHDVTTHWNAKTTVV